MSVADRGAHRRRAWLIAAAAVVVALLLVLAGWSIHQALGDTSAGGATASPAPATQISDGVPTAMTAEQLESLAAATSTPIYWAGPEQKTTYEVTRTSNGSTYVRYLPQSVAIGSKSADYLTVATYLQSGAYTYLSNAKGQKGVTTTSTQSGALVAQYEAYPKSAYFSFPNANFQVEVFSPDAGKALPLVLDGSVMPVS